MSDRSYTSLFSACDRQSGDAICMEGFLSYSKSVTGEAMLL
ncbi:hypothetical protein [Trichocoleus sp. FACHB-90]|nr:hypothetical protein [Trichocoleus sp. FACHB-90]